MGVSRGGYYAWVNRKKSRRVLANEELLKEIKVVHEDSREIYGYPRVYAALKRKGFVCGKHRVARIMRENGIMGKKARRFRQHKSGHQSYISSKNLLLNRDAATSTNQVWVGDITFIRIGEKWSYLSVVMDLYSRKIIGWTFNKNRGADMVSESLLMAARDHNVTPETIFHSDQGSEYASRIFTTTLRETGLRASMSRKGHCWDNASMESFFHSLKTEMIYFNHFKTLAEAMSYIIDYMKFYNNVRLHSGIGYLTPIECELMAA